MTVRETSAPLEANTHGLQRRLTGRQLTMIGLGGAIGTGLFLGSGLAISQAGPSTIIAYVVCGLVALVIAWALAEMVVVHPTAGAFGVLAHSYIGRWAGFVVRWTYWAIQCIAIGGEVIAAGIFVRFWWPEIPLWLTTIVFSIAILGVNASAVKLFGKVEYWFAMIKVSAIVAFILLGVALIVFGLPSRPPVGVGNLVSDGGFMPNGVEGLLLAMVFVIFSFIGTEVVSVTAAESENPVRDVVRATRSMALRLALFYVVAITIVLAVVPWTDTAQVGSNIQASPFVLVFAAAGIPAAATIMNFVVLTAALSSANANLYLTTRMLHSLAAHRYAPQWTGKLTKGGAPALALILSSAGIAAGGNHLGGRRRHRVPGALRNLRFRGACCLDLDPDHPYAIPHRSCPSQPPAVTGKAEGCARHHRAGDPVPRRRSGLNDLHRRPDLDVDGRCTFFVLLLVAYHFVDKRTKGGGDRYDPLQEEIARTNAVSPASDLEPAAEGAN